MKEKEEEVKKPTIKQKAPQIMRGFFYCYY